MSSTSRTATSSVIAALVLCGTIGCAKPARFTPPGPALPPSEVAVERTTYPSIPASVVIPNFVVTQIDAPYSGAEEARAREYFAVAVPNTVQESLAAYGVFSQVERVSKLGPTDADFVLQGEYGHVERLQGRNLEPDEMLVRGDLEVWLVDVRSGKETFRKLYSEERKLPKRADPSAPQLEPEYMTRLATDLKGDAERLAGFARPAVEVVIEDEPAAEDERFVEERAVARPEDEPARTASPRPSTAGPARDAAPPAKPVAAERTAPVAAQRPAPVPEERKAPVTPERTAPVAAKPTAPVAAERPAPVAAKRPVPADAKRTAPVPAQRAVPVAAERAIPVAADVAPAVAPPPGADEDVEDWAIRMRRGLTEPTP
jgi:hypothetical protein